MLNYLFVKKIFVTFLRYHYYLYFIIVFDSVKMNRMSERIKLSWSNEPSQIKSHQPDPQKHLKLHRLFLWCTVRNLPIFYKIMKYRCPESAPPPPHLPLVFLNFIIGPGLGHTPPPKIKQINRTPRVKTAP